MAKKRKLADEDKVQAVQDLLQSKDTGATLESIEVKIQVHFRCGLQLCQRRTHDL